MEAMRRIGALAALLLIASALAAGSAAPVLASGGYTVCQSTSQNPQAGEVASSGGFIVGGRATIEGQNLTPCVYTGSPYATGSFQWASIENLTPAWNIGVNIVQLGYGRCDRVNNNLGLGTVCDGNYHYYWAWGRLLRGQH